MCPSLWPDAREATVYFPYPQKDVNLERSGPLPVAADLGARRLAYRCTWERNCIKNAFSLAGFRRVKDGTELRALKGVRGEASPDGSGSGLADFVGGLLGLAPTGAAGGKKEGQEGPRRPRDEAAVVRVVDQAPRGRGLRGGGGTSA